MRARCWRSSAGLRKGAIGWVGSGGSCNTPAAQAAVRKWTVTSQIARAHRSHALSYFVIQGHFEMRRFLPRLGIGIELGANGVATFVQKLV